MIDQETTLAILEASDKRRVERRRFLTMAGGGIAAMGGLTLLSGCNDDSPTPSPTPSPTSTTLTDADVLNFALNLEYLEAQFYAIAVTGSGLISTMVNGTGTQGGVTGGRKVTFTDPAVQAYAIEIAADERTHVQFLRTQLGSSAVAMPSINIDGGSNGAFTAAARAAGLITNAQTFDPYASDENFLLAAFIFEDVGVTAYKGASPLITNKTYLEAAAGILAAEAYHAGLVRTSLYAKGIRTPSLQLIESAGKISDARDSLDGTSDDDQGIASMTDAAGNVTSNIVPADANGIAYSRNTNQVLHIVYLNAAAGTASGGFFPNGVNGTIKTAAANP